MSTCYEFLQNDPYIALPETAELVETRLLSSPLLDPQRRVSSRRELPEEFYQERLQLDFGKVFADRSDTVEPSRSCLELFDS
jgi:hypothetical protein